MQLQSYCDDLGKAVSHMSQWLVRIYHAYLSLKAEERKRMDKQKRNQRFPGYGLGRGYHRFPHEHSTVSLHSLMSQLSSSTGD